MPSAPANAEHRQRQIADEIARLGPCLPGSLVERMTRCGSPRCRCHRDPSRLHGPYPSWIRKAGTKTITRTLTPVQAERYRPLFENTKRLRELISELQTLAPGTPATAKTPLQITCPRRSPEPAATTAKTPKSRLEIRAALRASATRAPTTLCARWRAR